MKISGKLNKLNIKKKKKIVEHIFWYGYVSKTEVTHEVMMST